MLIFYTHMQMCNLSIYKIDDFQTRRLGSTVVAQTMNSGISAYLAGKLGLGNQVSTNSCACTTGTESILMGYDRIISGQANRMLVGSTSDSGPYIWAGFDAMKVCTFKHNESPEKGSRPMSATASGFVPGSGAGALILEELETALARKATIYAEVLGGNVNSGGQRGEGTMTAPNSIAVQRCIIEAMKNAGIKSKDIDSINYVRCRELFNYELEPIDKNTLIWRKPDLDEVKDYLKSNCIFIDYSKIDKSFNKTIKSLKGAIFLIKGICIYVTPLSVDISF